MKQILEKYLNELTAKDLDYYRDLKSDLAYPLKEAYYESIGNTRELVKLLEKVWNNTKNKSVLPELKNAKEALDRLNKIQIGKYL